MRRYSWIFLFFIFFFILSLNPVSARSNYVLPYPSYMPGSIFYKIHLVFEGAMKCWYFGNFGQFEYNLKQSDKYLVEAKTLFEYKQYLLAYQALQKSDRYFNNIQQYLIKAQEEGKNIVQKQNKFKEASSKHMEVLNAIKQQIPEKFIWQPEKAFSTTLHLSKIIENSIEIRNKNL